MSSHRSWVSALAAIGLMLIGVGPAAAQRAAESTDANGELQRAYEAAVSSAKGAENLDPAYELLGIAGTAQARNLKPLAPNASSAFVELVQRAGAAALRKGGSFARDTLDQLVDLRFLAKSEEIQPAMQAIDAALRSLFPQVSQSLQHDVDAAKDWDERVDALNELGSLQSSAVQVMMGDAAGAIAQAFDAKIAVLDKLASQEADDAERARKLASLAEARRSREEQVADASANTVDAVAAQLRSSDKDDSGRSGSRPPSAGDSADGSCVETGYVGKAIAQKYQRSHDRACVDSGRIPGTKRCPVANLSLACYARIPDGETITYVYRNTPEEAFLRKACSSDDQLPASRVPAAGAPFRSRDVSYAFTCAPSGESAAD